MLYHSHPLDDEGITVYSTHSGSKYSPSQNGGLAASGQEVLDQPLFNTIHHLDKCKDCHVYIRHVDHAFSINPTLTIDHSKNGTYLEGIEVGQRLQIEEDNMRFSRYRSRLQAAQKREDDLRFSQDQYRYQVERLEREMVVLIDRLMAMQMAYDDVVEDCLREGRPSHSTTGFASFDAQSNLESPRIVNSTPDSLHAARHETRSLSNFDNDHRRQRTGHQFSDEDDDFLLMQQLHFMEDSDGDHTSESQSDGYLTSSSSSALSALSSDPLNGSDNSYLNHDSPVFAPAFDTELSISELSILIEAAQEEGNREAVDEVKLLIQDAQRTPRKLRTSAQLYLLLTWRTPIWISNPSTSQTPAPSMSQIAATTFQTQSAESLPFHPEVFVDASAFGVGFIFNEQWLAWKFTTSPLIPVDVKGKIIMSWAEIIALELGVLTLIAAGYRDVNVTLRSDNLGVVQAVKVARWTTNHNLEGILQRVLLRCRQSGLRLNVKWVSTKANPADKPSRGVYPSASLLFRHPPALPRHLSHLVEQVVEPLQG